MAVAFGAREGKGILPHFPVLTSFLLSSIFVRELKTLREAGERRLTLTGSLTTEWPGFRARNHARVKHSWSIDVLAPACLGQDGVLVKAPLMCRALKPKLAFRQGDQSCGGAQIQASCRKAEVLDKSL
jgi:hypothetical protein